MRNPEARSKTQEAILRVFYRGVTKGIDTHLGAPAGRRALFAFCFLLITSYFLLLSSLHAVTPHSITIDGNLSEWHSDEIIWDDSHNDSPWGVANEIHALYLTWDASDLYIAVSGVQKDGNNLIVYIDTSSLAGITDASALKEPGNPSSLWWWRRGNKFAEGFRPDFQWHMYEMNLNPGDGHGFFRLRPDGNTDSLNGSAQQAASGGGAGAPGSAEIKIPWSVLYGGAGFPEGEVIRIAAMVTGGMDTRGTADTSDDLFGSARDAAPDQTAPFPGVWHESYTIDTWLTVNLESPPGSSSGAGRSSVPRDLAVFRKSSDTVVVSWRQRGVVEKKLHEYRIYSGDGLSADEWVAVPSSAAVAEISRLVSGTTYHFYVRAFYDADGDGSADFAGGKSAPVSVLMSRPSITHEAQSFFFFGGKKVPLRVDSESDISSASAYLSTDDGSTYAAVPMSVSARSAIAEALCEPGRLLYYFEVSGAGGVHRLPHDAPAGRYETFVVVRSSALARVSPDTETLDFGGGVRLALAPDSLRENTLIFCEYSDYSGSDPSGDGLSAAAFYDFYALAADGRRLGVVLEKPAELTLRYFDEDMPAGAVPGQLLIARIDGGRATRLETLWRDNSANLVTARIGHLSSFGVFAETSGESASPGYLRKVVRPVFRPSLGEVVEFDVGHRGVTVEIFDLKGAPVRKTENNFWDGRDSSGVKAAPGVYLWRISAQDGQIIYGSCVVVR